jgi:hypothetical protein
MKESSNNGVATLDAQETKKQRKKQAKREAKMMLKLDQARADAERAEQKLAKAQARLEAARTHLHDMETRAEELRASHAAQGEVPTEQTEQQEVPSPLSEAQAFDVSEEDETSTDGQSAAAAEAASHTDISAPTGQVTARLPVEERVEVAQEQEHASDQSEEEVFVLSEEDETSTSEE